MRDINKIGDLTIGDYIFIHNSVNRFPDKDKHNLELITYFNRLECSDQDNTLFIEKLSNILISKPVFIQRFLLNGVEYGFLPNLDHIGVIERDDVLNYQNDEVLSNKLVNIFYRPVKKKINFLFKTYYSVDDYKDNSVELLDAPLDVYFGLIFMFHKLRDSLLINYYKK